MHTMQRIHAPAGNSCMAGWHRQARLHCRAVAQPPSSAAATRSSSGSASSRPRSAVAAAPVSHATDAPHADVHNSKPMAKLQHSSPSPSTATHATLLLSCQDKKGVIAAVAQLLFGFGCNILSSDQFSDVDQNMFFQRVYFDYSESVVGPGNTVVLERAIAELANRYDMTWRISYRNTVKRMAILVSKQDHCLWDLLIRFKNGELSNCELPVIVSNHPDLKHVADMFGVPFRCLPIVDKSQKQQQEAEVDKIIEEYKIDVLVLARYMQIFSTDFCNRHWKHTINIHHSFLPAFEGARPYHRAHERGVKIIGATAHYATSELDAGPIIQQDITRITHRDSVSDMIRKGKDLERLVLSQAVRWHLDDRVMVHGNKTIVFED